MQLLACHSEEGQEQGLGYVDARAVRITVPQGSALKVPHIGWMEVNPTGRGRLFVASPVSERFYFDHSYHVVCADHRAVSATFSYGAELCCALEQANVFGVQFHPEKSHRFGMRLLNSFGQLA
jgi:glutamine amidotransferase